VEVGQVGVWLMIDLSSSTFLLRRLGRGGARWPAGEKGECWIYLDGGRNRGAGIMIVIVMV
jgi:hypothetical protein